MNYPNPKNNPARQVLTRAVNRAVTEGYPVFVNQSVEEFEPDCFDLNDWVLLTQPELYEATKYLSPTAQYNLWRSIWINAGKPDISKVNL